ncbi:alpha-L-fucosidase [Olivibacter domesticus]|uniref:alpha-L-fucosidase n=1 Tax=Olivibacter domesticus TaxID=407022 RepID=A0A1H7QFN6_OLID1|nr:alpha-L-fucosidase [Olivibacter domesticus]SEL46716.1 alpha-L-fucosidase [Olivibacter domesticus]
MKSFQQLRRVYWVLICIILSTGLAHAQKRTEKDNERMKWWTEARFGMFIHWGVYAQFAGVYKGHEQARGGAEWIMNRSKIPVSEYQDMAKEFNPINYDPDEWVRMAKEAGMKYLIITAKHHDGFALFKSAASKWNVVDATPHGKDLLKPLAEACRKYGIKLGFYYSQAQDWNNPGGSAARKEMREGWPNPDSARIDAYTLAHKGHWDPAQETSTFDEYIDRVSVPQVKELMTNYGDIAVLWWDTPTNMTDQAAMKLQAQLKLQPDIITNDRLKRPNFPGDTKTPEQKIPDLSELDGKYWETCMTMNGTWGYRTSDNKWKSTETLIRNLIDIASKGGNYLLNVGPKPDGTFPEQSIERLKQIGDWMKVNSEAIYTTKASPLTPLTWGRCTMKAAGDNTILYLSVFDWPADGKLSIPGITNKISSAKLLATDQKLKGINTKEGFSLELPANAPDKIASVIKLELKGKIAEANHAVPKKQMKSGALD